MTTGLGIAARFARAGLNLRRSSAARLTAILQSCKQAAVTLSLSLVFVGIQMALAIFLAGQRNALAGWRAFFQYDSAWFQKVILLGYFKPEVISLEAQGNLHFFPAYPLLCSAVHHLTGFDFVVSMLLAASVAYCGFWIYFLLLARRWQVPAGITGLAAAAVILHPVSFYLVSAYSESLFLFALFGFIYWLERDGPVAKFIAGLHGFVLTATRIVGMPLVIYPWLRALARDGQWSDSLGVHARRFLKLLPVMVMTAAGAGAYLIYLQVQFGNWAVFIENAERGWGVHSTYSALLKPRTYNLYLAARHVYPLDPDVLSRLCAQLCLLAFAVLAGAELVVWRAGDHHGWRQRLGLYYCAFALFALPVTSHACVTLWCFARFSLLPAAVLALAAAQLAASAPETVRWRWLRWPLGAALIGSTVANVLMTMRFASGGFVA
jgi:hypothetical protein